MCLPTYDTSTCPDAQAANPVASSLASTTAYE